MSDLPNDLKYSQSHEWLRDEGDGVFAVGITEHAQELLGDLVFVELPEVGRMVSAGEEAGVVESVKAASDLYSPLAGKVVAVNNALDASPELVNQAPYGDGWVFKVQLEGELPEGLLDAAGYQGLLDES